MVAKRPGRISTRRRNSVAVAVVSVLMMFGAHTDAASAQSEEVLKFGVVGFYTPRLMFEEYQPFMDFLSHHTGRTWELVIHTDYQAAIDDLCSGTVTAAFLGPFSYVRAHEQCGAEPVVRLMTRGLTTYRTTILVRDDSPVDTLAELQGRHFGFGVQLSTSSHLVPRSMLVDAGLDLDTISCVYYTTNERALRAVLIGEVEACGVRDLINEQVLHRGLRVIAQSEALPNHPLAVSPSAVDEVAPLLVEALVDRPSSNPEIEAQLKMLNDALSAGFEPVADVVYDPVRQLADRVFGRDALVVPAHDLACGSGGAG